MRKWSMKPRYSIAILLTVAVLMVGWGLGLGAQPQPAGEVVIAFPVTIAPAWFDPAETPAQITPFAFLYALHDGLVRPLPGAPGEQPGRRLDGEPRWVGVYVHPASGAAV